MIPQSVNAYMKQIGFIHIVTLHLVTTCHRTHHMTQTCITEGNNLRASL